MKKKWYFSGHLILTALAFLGWLARFVSPAFFGYLQYLTFFLFPFTIFITLLVLIQLIKGKSRLFYIDVLLLVVLLFDLRNNIQWNSVADAPTANSFTVITYNVAGYTMHPENISAIAETLARQHADIVCLQEFGYDSLAVRARDTLTPYCSKVLNLPHYKFFRASINNCGLAIFSRYKITMADTIYLETRSMNGAIYCEVATESGPVGIINYHLYSYNLNNKPYIPYATLAARFGRINTIFQKVYKNQEAELDKIMKQASRMKGPLILAGDLNNIPDSYFYRRLSRKYNDSFMEKGRGRGITYPLSYIGLRIDYQFSSDALKVQEHTILYNFLSDHFALKVRYTFKND